MAFKNCLICKTKFYVKPSHLALGWGKYCSTDCRTKAQLKGKIQPCFICKKRTYKSISRLLRSKSKLYFCSKTCQTIWRNKILYSGRNHYNWKTGINSYRKIQISKGVSKECILCQIKDERVLIVHHLDHNRKNNDERNLTWLCCNCHYLVHQYPEIDSSLRNLVTVAQLV